MDEVVLQSILGTDKRNPFLVVCRRRDNNKLEIYYGLQRLETVVDDKNHISYRATVGRLYNAGLNRATLCKVFGVDRKTMQRWGQALLMPDAESSIRALRSRTDPRKLTVDVRRFAEVRFGHIYPRNRHSYSSQIRQEIYETFGQRISSESLRLVFKECRCRLPAGVKEKISGDRDSGCEASNDEQEDERCSNDSERPYEQDDGGASGAQSDILGKPNYCPLNPVEPHVRYVHHAGVLLFSVWLTMIQTIHANGALLKQWLAMVLLEAVNIEQSKYVSWDCLSSFLGWTVPWTVEQRRALEEIGQSQGADAVLGLNAVVAGVDDCRDYYYDPHTKHYTGKKNVLKGWCSNIRWADKALHCDYIHTSGGMPVFIEYADNYQDLRERFVVVIERFRKATMIKADAVLTMVMDRGVYGMDVFDAVKQNPLLDLVTWEKGFTTGQWDENRCSGTFLMARTRNHSTDLRSYRFAYIDERWKKNEAIRRLIVHATNPQGRCVEVSILSTELVRDAENLIRLMFWRWIQENDFKYLDKHYGINQITSYASIDYAELRTTLADKQIENAERKALLSERRKCQEHLKRVLHKEHNRTKQITRSKETIAEIDKSMDILDAQDVSKKSEEYGALSKKKSRQHAIVSRLSKLDVSQEKLASDQQIETLNEQIAACDKKVSKLDSLVEQGYERIDVTKKRVMDSVKILARNLFYKALAPFKETYDNYRDDHEYFRCLTLAPGLWVESAEGVTVYLEPAPHLPPKIERCFQKVLDDLQKTPLILPDGSGRIVTLKLRPNEGIKLALA